MSSIDRRSFLKATLAASAAGLSACTKPNSGLPVPTPSKSVMNLIVEPMATVRIGVIGVGQRGHSFVRRFCNIDGATVVAICDINPSMLDRAQEVIVDHDKPLAALITGDDYAYRKMLDRDDIDIVIIATPWRWHTPMAVDTMQSGKHAFVEVPAAPSVEEAWQLVEISEQTQMNCMMMENVCYGREELMVLNMVRKGLFGEILHGEAAYLHELRWQMKSMDHGTGSWRTSWHAKRNGNLYPTHGLGPVSQYMNINRGDQFDYMNSMSSPAKGRAEYAREEFPENHPRNQMNYINGDMSTSLIKTKKGRTIMVQHDTTTPRPYSRHNLIQGTNGVFAGFPNRIALEDGMLKPPQDEERASFHKWDYDMEPWFAKYDHPLYLRIGEQSVKQGGHGGMDFTMCWRMIYCLRNGEPLDQNVYDAAAWSVIAPLSAESVADRGNSRDIPDFTRGQWQVAKPLGIVS
ncbi:MAG: Gfo/Idh/MocA family protein [Gammaproteobacteria bacterium]